MAGMIKTVNLTKRYGTLVALSNLNLEINEGDCFGFIGPNGAGKTTTIKILATLLQPTWGEARVCDYVVGYESRKIRPLIGFVPDYFGAYEDMVVQEYLEFFAAAYNINGPNRTKIVNDVLELTDLGYKRDAMVDGLSRGMRQRLSIARVLVHDPKVLLLDEPAGNLDPRARIEMRELLKELRRMGKTILISSHILPELADLCNKIGIIEQGELIYSGPVSDIIRRAKAGTALQVQAGGKRKRYLLIRCAYLGILLFLVIFLLLQASGNLANASLSDLSKQSAEIFYYMSYAQLALVALLAPIFTAGAITQEKDSQTYDILLSTPLTNGQIVLGSLLSRLFFVVTLLISGLPIFAITQIFVGVVIASITLSFLIDCAIAFVTADLAIDIAVL